MGRATTAKSRYLLLCSGFSAQDFTELAADVVHALRICHAAALDDVRHVTDSERDSDALFGPTDGDHDRRWQITGHNPRGEGSFPSIVAFPVTAHDTVASPAPTRAACPATRCEAPRQGCTSAASIRGRSSRTGSSPSARWRCPRPIYAPSGCRTSAMAKSASQKATTLGGTKQLGISLSQTSNGRHITAVLQKHVRGVASGWSFRRLQTWPQSSHRK